MQLIKRLFKSGRREAARREPRVLERSEHSISRADISESALRVLYRLNKAGFQAYLVGGGVRDLMLGREPKDFDVCTDAHPDEVRELFRNCRLIGRRFRLAHVRFGREIIEVATFRALPSADGDQNGDVEVRDGRVIRDNVYGTLEEDAQRRDFTVNALYYNIADFSVVDYSTGLDDLDNGLLRLIGDAETRLREDPVRMLRAVRFAAKLGFRIAPEIEALMPAMAPLLADIPAARLFEEFLKLFQGGAALPTFELLRRYALFGYLFPQTEDCLDHVEETVPHRLLTEGLTNTDDRVREGLSVTPAFLLACLLWEPVCRERDRLLQSEGLSEHDALQQAADLCLQQQVARIAIPRRFTQMTRDIWLLQNRLARNTGKRPLQVAEHPRFRAAYDFLVLRSRAGEPVRELADWWTAFQAGDDSRRGEMLAPDKKRRRPRRRRRKPSAVQ